LVAHEDVWRDAAMKCPYCHAEMEKGYLKSSRMMHWGSERELGYVRNDIHLTKSVWKGMVEGCFAESYYCRTCRNIMVPLNEI